MLLIQAASSGWSGLQTSSLSLLVQHPNSPWQHNGRQWCVYQVCVCVLKRNLVGYAPPVKSKRCVIIMFPFFWGVVLVLTKLFHRRKARSWLHMLSISRLTKLNDAWRKLETLSNSSQAKVGDVFLVSRNGRTYLNRICAFSEPHQSNPTLGGPDFKRWTMATWGRGNGKPKGTCSSFW